MCYKKTGTHKDIINYQYEVLNMKCTSVFYQRQCGVAKTLLQKYALDDIMLILEMFKEFGKPKEYKSVYFFTKVDVDKFISHAKELKKQRDKEVLEEEVVNIKKKEKLKIEL